MKDYFSIDSIAVAFVSAVGYGIGYLIPEMYGMSVFMCWVICLGAGFIIESLAEGIMFSKYIQTDNGRRAALAAYMILIFLIAYIICLDKTGYSLFYSLGEEMLWYIAYLLLGFVIGIIKYNKRKKRILERYQEGKQGYSIKDNEKEYIKSLNGINREIEGDYDDSYEAKTHTGTYLGKCEGGVVCYFGIPYAKPPVGQRRWKAPEPLQHTDRVFEAFYHGASCIQYCFPGNPLSEHRQSEDCLYLDVWTGNSRNKKKPVLVYIHGGDSVFGGSANPVNSGYEFVKKNEDTVFVGFNYRLGILGFIDFSGIPGGEQFPDTKNLGLLDQIEALKWIKENIEAFGGDPENITVIGDTIGAVCLSLLAVCDKAKGLFRRAVIISGTPEEVLVDNSIPGELGKTLAAELDAKSMDELLSVSEDTLAQMLPKLVSLAAEPVCDGVLITKDVYRAYKDGKAGSTEFMFCVSASESEIFKSMFPEGAELWNDEAWEAVLNRLGDKKERFLELYEEDCKTGDKKAVRNKYLDSWIFKVPAHLLCENISAAGSKAYFMYWDVKPVVARLGAGSLSAVTTILGNSEAAEAYGQITDKEMEQILQALLVKFMRGEDVGLYNNEIYLFEELKWREYTASERNALHVRDDRITCEENCIDEISRKLIDVYTCGECGGK